MERDMSRQTRTKRFYLPWSKATLIALAITVSTASIYGIVGNRADAALTWLMSQVSALQSFWLWITISILVVVYIGSFLYYWQRTTILHQTLNRSNKMLALDDSLLRVLASWIPPTLPSDHDEQLRRILKETLRDATIEFDGHVERADILLPDSTNTSYLRCWAHDQMPQESIDSMHFYIGNDLQMQRDRGGIAGKSFSSGEIIVGHMSQINGHWVCEDHEEYIRFQGTRPYCPYMSFVNVPIIGLSTHSPGGTTCLGVICFDSRRDDIFDSEEIKIVLRMFARRVASTILISEKLP